jgi:hypothetical protein
MKNKSTVIVILVFLLGSFEGFSQDFTYPLRVEPAVTYNKVRVDASDSEYKTKKQYRNTLGLGLEGEFKLGENFSILAIASPSREVNTNTATKTTPGRFGFGFRYAKVFDLGFGSLALGGGLKLFSRENAPVVKYKNENPDYYFIRPHISVGFLSGGFQAIAEFIFQSETNSSFREGQNDEFRRYKQAGLALSYKFDSGFGIILESQYREPYNRKVDTNTRFWYGYPGIFYKSSIGTFGVSFQASLIHEREYDRGLKLSYIYLF